MARKVRLTQRRLKWVQNRTVTLKGEPLRHNIASGNKFADRIDKLTRRMTEDMSRQLGRLFRTDEARAYFGEDASIASMAKKLLNGIERKYIKQFKHIAKPYSERMAKEVNKTSKSNMFSSLKKLTGGVSIKTDFISGEMKDILTATIYENVNLIERIPSTYFDQVRGAVMRSITQPETGGLEGLQETIQSVLDKRGKQIHNKARNTALDQTRKAYNNLNSGRMKAVGISKYQWVHSRGGQFPREHHLNELDGKIFSLDEPPIIEPKTGERGIPGQAINCRCTMLPLLEFDNGENNT